MKIMNWFYRTNKHVEKFNKSFSEEILLVEPTKVLTSKDFHENPQTMNWFLSNRTVTILTDKSIFFNKKKIDLTSLKNTKLFLYKTFLGFISYQVFCFQYDNQFYYLGMNSANKWQDIVSEVYPVKKTNYTSTILILLVVAVLLYFLGMQIYLRLR